MQGCRVGSDFWMRAWVHSTKDTGSLPFTIGIYALLGLTQFVWFALFALFLKLHEGALKRVLRSPMSFFDTTPLGRILNRFTRDMDSLDLVLCEFFRQFYQNTSRLVGAFVTISILVPIFLAPLAPLVVVSWLLIFVYMRTSVEVQRVAAMSRSPMYAHYSETLQGAATIRAFRSQVRFVLKNDRVLDDANRPQWYSLVAQNWVWLRIDYISHILSLIVCIIIIVQPTHWDSAAIGLMLMQATQMSAYMTYAGRGWTELQNNMNSVERIGYYANSLDQEEQQGHGVVIIRNLSLRYRPGLPLALKDINLEVFEGERVGVVGRSGAGKSSLISALFRLVEPCGGKIYVDGVDIHCAEAICILPQDPVLFDGTLRSNLDPLGEYSDTDIWSALESSRLKELVSQLPGRLDSDIGEGGDNFSAGQRQLFCLAPNCAIQRIIHSLPTTVISIAHRLQTIITYDKVAVIDEGQVVEFGSPLPNQYSSDDGPSGESSQQQHTSAFYSMVRELGEATANRMYLQAQAAAQGRDKQ
ncbi:P-loop containing nucleoside triphosphate hydrolase protein [Linderina pennispora]|uniref:p-loop containing nucleoside triphosphate hydrolase protein n=1 Tax=Linderina pennispora TaxID=61395 RepID=A0A1Y1W386_9FUNG|nr:P-loop containing nucleoside triphosphate hydrolase protein [Linderina pennispora]ORX67852.1 P-loop containing nucleoside triphosphate hydrolase protein [Linderina pennispora]